MRRPFFLWFWVCSFVVLLGLTANAAISRAEDFTFSVDAVLPENQIDPEKTFFDLRVTPGQEQEIQVRLRNSSRKKITLLVEVNTAYTNSNGLIEYDRTDPTLNVDLDYSVHELAQVMEPEVTLDPNESKLVTIRLTIPEQPFEGLLLGGIYVRPKADAASAQEKQGVVKNVQSMVKGLRLSESDNPVTPELKMPKAYAGQIGYRNVFLATIENPKPMILTDVKIKAAVYKKEDQEKAILTNQSDQFKFAPNSKMEYGVFLNEQLFEAGDYVMKLHVESQDQTWEFSQPLKVTTLEAQQFNELVAQEDSGNRFGWLKWLAAMVFVIALLILCVFLVRKNERMLAKWRAKLAPYLLQSDTAKVKKKKKSGK